MFLSCGFFASFFAHDIVKVKTVSAYIFLNHSHFDIFFKRNMNFKRAADGSLSYFLLFMKHEKAHDVTLMRTLNIEYMTMKVIRC